MRINRKYQPAHAGFDRAPAPASRVIGYKKHFISRWLRYQLKRQQAREVAEALTVAE